MLEVKKIRCSRNNKIIFDDISFKLAPSETLLIKGKNGVGKSSLLRIISGNILNFSGEIIWKNELLKESEDDLKANLVHIGHKNLLSDFLTPKENLYFILNTFNLNIDKLKLEESLIFDKLGSTSDIPVNFLSQGQKRRVILNILNFLYHRKLWLIDEPFPAMDTDSVVNLTKKLNKFTSDGGILILTSHQEINLNGKIKIFNMN